jgi:hypothetical protein
VRPRLVVGTLLAAVAWLHGGCATPTFDLDVTISPIAVGARAIGTVKSGTCDDDGCSYEDVEIASLSLDPLGVFELASEPAGGELTFTAVAGGVTTLELVAKTDDETKTFTHTLAALPIDSIAVTARQGQTDCGSPAVYSTSTVAMLPIELRSAGTLLHGEAFAALDADHGAIDAARSNASTLALEMPASPGRVTLTSAATPSFAYAVEAIAPSAISSVTLRAEDSFLTPLTSTEVVVEVFAGERFVCGDGLTHTVTTQTPTSCRIVDDEDTVTSVSGVGLWSVRVIGVRSGVCTLRVTLGTSSVTATTSLDVTM